MPKLTSSKNKSCIFALYQYIPMNFLVKNIVLGVFFIPLIINAQYLPKGTTKKQLREAKQWVNKTYRSLNQDEKLGQLFIVALYTNKGEEYIQNVRQFVEKEQLGGLILMQDDAQRHIDLVNEFQAKSKVPMLIGMDAEWGLYQRIPKGYKLPWAITLGAIQDKNIIYEMGKLIAQDAKKMGVNWNFAPVVDVNTNPANPIIGNRSFGSEVQNVISSAQAYVYGLQDNGVLAAIKHFPGHGDTSMDSHYDLPVVEHDLQRLKNVEIAPFKALADKGVGGVMVAHLFVPELEKGKDVPASISKSIITDLLKKELDYKGLIITDALNMGAVAKRYKAGELDALAFKAGNDLMLFSEGVSEGKRLIIKSIKDKEIPKRRLEESVKKILLTKYFLGLNNKTEIKTQNINNEINTEAHSKMAQKIYQNAITLIKNQKNTLPLAKNEEIYYLPLEEAPFQPFENELKKYAKVITISKNEIATIPQNSKVIVGLHKDNSTAYKPYQISEESKDVLTKVSKNHNVILNVFGSPYALRDLDISQISSVLVSYENNDDAMVATAKALMGRTKIRGRLPVLVNENLKNGAGIDLEK